MDKTKTCTVLPDNMICGPLFSMQHLNGINFYAMQSLHSETEANAHN